MLWQAFYPDRCEDSALKIDYAKEYEKGIRGVAFDIDNTLVPHRAAATEETIAFFKKLHAIGLKTCLISNNDEGRVRPFAKRLNSFYMHKAAKPSRRGYRKAMEQMGTDANSTLFVGDQILTDVYGAKRAGIKSILVRPIKPDSDPLQVKLKRIFEKIVLKEYKMARKQAK